jgi:hypothetical protein
MHSLFSCEGSLSRGVTGYPAHSVWFVKKAVIGRQEEAVASKGEVVIPNLRELQHSWKRAGVWLTK